MKKLFLSLVAASAILGVTNILAVKEVSTLDEFNQILQSQANVVVDFYAPWCGPCKSMSPILERIANANKDITIIKVNSDRAKAICGKYGIRSLPTFIFFKDGNQVKKFSGARSQAQFEQEIKNAFS